MGAFVGSLAGRSLAVAAKAEPGVLVRWETTGLLVGSLAGAIFAGLLIRCTVGFGGRLRRRVADPITVALGFAGVLGLLMRRAKLPPPVMQLETAIAVLVWLLSFIFVVLAIRCRPRARPVASPMLPGPEVVPPEEDAHV
jgi:hypothetical protein